MSVQGYLPAVSDTSVPSATSAASSSHQLAKKRLKALEEQENTLSTQKQLLESTDEKRGRSEQNSLAPHTTAGAGVYATSAEAFTASSVPNVP